MKAYRVLSYGGPVGSSLTEAEKPKIADNEVLVRIHAAAVNPVDWKVQDGYLRSYLPHKLPLTIGWDYAGVVVATGPLVGRNLLGDHVFGMADITRDGTFADFVAVREDYVARAPYTLNFTAAAALPLAAIAAWTALFIDARLVAGETVLIHAGAGGVGSMAVQMAKFAGAHVTTTCSAGSMNLVRSLGADVVIDYEREDFSKMSGFDVVIDTVGGAVRDRSWQVLRPGGMIVTLVPPFDPDERPRGDVASSMAGARPNGQLLAHIAGLIDAGRLRPVIAETFEFEQIERALEVSRQGHAHGKLVINIASAAAMAG